LWSSVDVDLTNSTVKLSVGETLILIDGAFPHPVVTSDSLWILRDEKELNIILAKEIQDNWWNCALIGDPEIDTSQFPHPETEKKRIS